MAYSRISRPRRRLLLRGTVERGIGLRTAKQLLERGRERLFRGRHSRLDGLLIARRAEHYRLFCAYAFTVFVNPATALLAAEVAAAFGAERIFGPDDFP